MGDEIGMENGTPLYTVISKQICKQLIKVNRDSNPTITTTQKALNTIKIGKL